MTVFTVGKNGRVYQRKFDWDEARARHNAGEGYTALARAYGVSINAVKRVCDPVFKVQMDARREAHIHTGVCEDCGQAGVTSAAFRRTRPSKHGRVLCAGCGAVEKRTRYRFDKAGTLVAVRCNMADCAHGDRWQPPGNFPRGENAKDLRPGGFHSVCRDCNTRMRRDHRARNREAQAAHERDYRRAYRARKKAAA
jgi:hypothetical protein